MHAKEKLPAIPRTIQLFLRIKHPNIVVDDITTTLGITPEHARSASSTNEPRRHEKSHAESYWLANVSNSYEDIYGTRLDTINGTVALKPFGIAREDIRALTAGGGPVDVQILTTLRRLQAHSAFIAKIWSENGSVTLIVDRLRTLGPFTLAPVTAARLGELGIALEVDR